MWNRGKTKIPSVYSFIWHECDSMYDMYVIQLVFKRVCGLRRVFVYMFAQQSFLLFFMEVNWKSNSKRCLNILMKSETKSAWLEFANHFDVQMENKIILQLSLFTQCHSA